MYDPMTVAFSIRRPWKDRPTKHFPEGYRPEIARIWHVDPETDGTDDSCGWFAPKLTREDKLLAIELARDSSYTEYFFEQPSRVTNPKYPSLNEISPGDCLALTLAALEVVAWRLDRKDLTPKIHREVVHVGTSVGDNFRHVFARCSDPMSREEAWRIIIRFYRRISRPWYKHPRWHIRHWKVQIIWVQDLKRYLFSRCATCGGRFRWGASVVSNNWDSSGPRWFKGEEDVHHTFHHGPFSPPGQAAGPD